MHASYCYINHEYDVYITSTIVIDILTKFQNPDMNNVRAHALNILCEGQCGSYF